MTIDLNVVEAHAKDELEAVLDQLDPGDGRKVMVAAVVIMPDGRAMMVSRFNATDRGAMLEFAEGADSLSIQLRDR